MAVLFLLPESFSHIMKISHYAIILIYYGILNRLYLHSPICLHGVVFN